MLAAELGLAYRPGLTRDSHFWLAAAAGPLVAALLPWLLPMPRAGAIAPWLLLSLLVWQPLVEETFFRGVLQGQLHRVRWARRRLAGFSVANWLVTLLFALAHLASQPPAWALAVVAPSLVFGHLRDRQRHIYGALLLHAFYNGCYLAAVARLS